MSINQIVVLAVTGGDLSLPTARWGISAAYNWQSLTALRGAEKQSLIPGNVSGT